MDAELREALTALGLHTVGSFAALDAADVEQRWGATGLGSWRFAHGVDTRRPVLGRTDATRFVSTELAMSADSMEPVLFIVRAALGQLVDALVRDARAAAEAEFGLVGGEPHDGRTWQYRSVAKRSRSAIARLLGDARVEDAYHIDRAAQRVVLDKTISGEYPVCVMILNYHATISIAQGAPVRWLSSSPAMWGVPPMPEVMRFE